MPMTGLILTLDIKLYKVVIIESFGSGNSFSAQVFFEAIKKYISKGGIVLNTTQCIKGSVVQGKYETSDAFNELGVISLGDATIETAICKTMYALGKFKKASDQINF